MTLERFEEILRWKFNNGVKSFWGNLSGNHYEIQNLNNNRNRWTLFINDNAAKVNTNFFSIACEIWDCEMLIAVPEELR